MVAAVSELVPGEIAVLIERVVGDGRILDDRRITPHCAVDDIYAAGVVGDDPRAIGAGVGAGIVPAGWDDIGPIDQTVSGDLHVAANGERGATFRKR